MQHVAAEMNLSETAFVHPIEPGPLFCLRWFTPRVEVDLCGHATLAAARRALGRKNAPPAKSPRFETRSGRLSARRQGGSIELDFPAEATLDSAIIDQLELDRIVAALNAPLVFAGRNRFDLLVELADEKTVRELQPDYRLIASFPDRGVIATSQASSPGFDFVSRFFAPRVGVDEDPVCGSAQCFLGPILGIKAGPHRADRPPGLAPRRSGEGPRRWTSRGPDRPGCDRAQGRAAGLTAGCKGTATACCQTAILTGEVPTLGREPTNRAGRPRAMAARLPGETVLGHYGCSRLRLVI